MKFGQGMDVDDPKVDLEDQGHRSKVKVTRLKKTQFRVALTFLQAQYSSPMFKGKNGWRSKVTGVKVKDYTD